ncbi:zinc-binding dehydrogenase [Novosphingobium sp. Leaf2]
MIDRRFPFVDVNAAFAYLDTGRTKGKVIVSLDRG